MATPRREHVLIPEPNVLCRLIGVCKQVQLHAFCQHSQAEEQLGTKCPTQTVLA